VVSSDALGRLPLKLVAPVREWKPAFAGNVWHVRLQPDRRNGRTKESAVDTLQIRGMDTQRFINRLGRLTALQMEEIAAAIALVVEYQ
jgi:mRNA interferase MazF